MTKTACWTRKSGNRPKRVQGVPQYGTQSRKAYDALRDGKEVKNFWGLVRLIDLYNMEADKIVNERAPGKRGPKRVISYSLRGEWHDHDFFPIERVKEIDISAVDFMTYTEKDYAHRD